METLGGWIIFVRLTVDLGANIWGLSVTTVTIPPPFAQLAVAPLNATWLGFLNFGDGPYNLNSSSLLSYTSLIMNKVSTGEEQVIKAEYFIGVKSIKINNKTVKLNTTLLQNKKSGYGGTNISTVNPYTVLETSIYNAVIKAFVNELKNVTRVPPMAPFRACFSSKNIGCTRVGPAVPTIDLVMEENGVVWRMFGANTMVRVNNNVLCLGFVDGGEPTFITSIVIGGIST